MCEEEVPEEGAVLQPDTPHHLSVSPALPISPPVLETIAVDATERQMKWLACIEEPRCNKKCTFSLNTKATFQ